MTSRHSLQLTIMKIQNFSLFALLAVMLGVMSSCSKKAELLDTIPANVTTVTTLNLRSLCEASGIKFTEEGIKASPEIEKNIAPTIPDVINNLAEMDAKGVADFSTIALVLDKNNTAFMTFAISDFERFKIVMEDAITWNADNDGFHTGYAGNYPLVANDSQIWILSRLNKTATQCVKDVLNAAKEMPISKLDGIAQALNRDNLANTAMINWLELPDKKPENQSIQEKLWNVAAINTTPDGKSIVLNWERMTSDGKIEKSKGMRNINPAVLAYVPEGFNLTFGAGLTPDFDWTPFETIARLIGGFQAEAFMNVITPYLESIDGTLLIAARPVTPNVIDSGDPSDWDFILLVHMPQRKINQLTATVSSMMATAGITPKAVGEGLIAVPQYGKEITIGNVDGYLGISTIGFDNTRNNSLAPMFVNKEMSLNIIADPLSDYINGAPEGVAMELAIEMSGGKGQAKFALPGSNGPILTYLLSIMLD